MTRCRQSRVLDLLGIEVPIVQAPMSGIVTPCMIVAVARAGGLGSLSLAALSPEESREMYRGDTPSYAETHQCEFPVPWSSQE